ncbi:hypothetical protein KSP39_PZI015012 [Platanthera zijinensis]|uniref:Putative plant transposon protein domain-containing protein n=1 Tax=Platanthera zijinensis TaxID=2320716 RepID=A0AAP0B9T3_9ASPA
MSSKRRSSKKKGKEVVREPVVKFSSEAVEYWFRSLKALPFIFERGFNMEKRAWSVTYAERIKALQWEAFCHPRTEAILPMVYEFYANAKSIEGEVVTVRGKAVEFSAEMISDMFNLEDHGYDDYAEILNKVSLQEMTDTVCCTPTPEWASRTHKVLKTSCLTREAKVWLLFINASIMPTRHPNTITLDKVALIYGILKGLYFDLGKIITLQLRQKIREEKPRQLWFPTLITELCLQAGVEKDEEDMVTPVKRHITETVVEVNVKVAVETQGRGRNWGIGGDAPTSQAPRVKLMRIDIPAVDHGTDPDLLMEHIEYIKAYQRCEHMFIKEQFEYMHANQRKLMEKRKIPVPEPKFRMIGQFDEAGYLLTSDKSRVDPARKAKEDDAEDDSDAEEDDDPANEDDSDAEEDAEDDEDVADDVEE